MFAPVAVLARWIVFGVFAFAAVRWVRRGKSKSTTVEAASTTVVPVEEDPYRFRFETIHRQIIGRERSFNVAEAKLGLTALTALILVEVYFPADLTLLDKVLAEFLFVSALIALFGFRFFAGYEAFNVKDFAEGVHSNADILLFTDKMVIVAGRNERMIAAKQRLMAWALLPILIVSGLVPFTRHDHGSTASQTGSAFMKKAGPVRDRLEIFAATRGK